jgi:hypothetical protein
MLWLVGWITDYEQTATNSTEVHFGVTNYDTPVGGSTVIAYC